MSRAAVPRPLVRQTSQLVAPRGDKAGTRVYIHIMTRYVRGFTIVELMVTLALASVVLAIGIPSIRTFVQNNRMTTQANSLLTDVMLARNEAIKRSTPVVMCSRNGAICRAGAAGNWDGGWLVFSDEDRDGAYDPDDGDLIVEAGEDDLITARGALRGVQSLRDPDGAGGNFANTIGFLDTGGLNVAGGTLILCDQRGAADARGIVLNRTGRAEVSDQQFDGSALVCP
jgi:type IV fimbrial biogenesis protein FimT